MERIQRALDIARTQRSAATTAPVAAPREPVEAPATDHALRHAPPLPIDRDALRRRRIVFAEDEGSAAAAYRMLRTQLLQRMRSGSARVIGVVSAADGEGKTLTAINLALSLAAEPNQTVLLADFDLRRPGVAAALGLDIRHGIDDWIAARARTTELFVRLEGIDRLAILPARSAVTGSSEALAAPRVRALLAEIKSWYEDRIVIIDLPPVLLADDLLAIATCLDGVLVVAAEGRTRREDLVRMRELLAPVRVLGTVLNRASESETRAY